MKNISAENTVERQLMDQDVNQLREQLSLSKGVSSFRKDLDA